MVAKYSHFLSTALERNSITPLHMDSRYIFLQSAEHSKIAHSFFGDKAESLERIAEKTEKHKVQAGEQDYVNVTVFLLIVLMEFRKKRSVMQCESVCEIDKDECCLLNALLPRLENSLNSALSKLCRGNDELKGASKKELMEVFTDYFGKLIRELANGDLNGVAKMLEIEAKAEMEFVKDVTTAVQECFQKDKIEENVEVLAEGIFAVLILC
eukprot:TRINITY_DN15172_c0_g2_i10.p1 TRINITY_DN15172_c0_g2~~TRINITY_DN15172_c0_g2_i10.p1  ORF type:complete len:212 (+),score=74.91 TRINITY_DN15172_c0_g2_i10:219-854(+)